MADGSKRLGLDEEEKARLRRESHGVIGEAGGESRNGGPGPLPLAPEPTNPGQASGQASGKTRKPRGASPPPPGPIDDGATIPVTLASQDELGPDNTPPPLPPSPASAAAEVWLEEAVTRPSAFADIVSLVGSTPGMTPAAGTPFVTDPVEAMREAHAQALRSMRMLLILSAVTAFAVGLALGALIFRT